MLNLCIFVGFLPFALGWIMNQSMIAFPNSVLPFGIIAIGTLLLWGGIAFGLERWSEGGFGMVLRLNLVGAAVLVLLGVQELVLKAYWQNFLGIWTQLYYLPLVNIGFTLTAWSHTVFTAYCAGFGLMVLVSWAGCRLARK